MSSYKKQKLEARELYKKIKFVSCPAFDNQPVNFTRVGFDHLIWKGRSERNRAEQVRRFQLLKYAKDIISNPNATILYRRENKEGLSPADFWQFVEIIRGRKIKVVIRQIDGGNKHFFSIMAGKTKKSP